jgi:hypothetical protein
MLQSILGYVGPQLLLQITAAEYMQGEVHAQTAQFPGNLWQFQHPLDCRKPATEHEP